MQLPLIQSVYYLPTLSPISPLLCTLPFSQALHRFQLVQYLHNESISLSTPSSSQHPPPLTTILPLHSHYNNSSFFNTSTMSHALAVLHSPHHITSSHILLPYHNHSSPSSQPLQRLQSTQYLNPTMSQDLAVLPPNPTTTSPYYLLTTTPYSILSQSSPSSQPLQRLQSTQHLNNEPSSGCPA